MGTQGGQAEICTFFQKGICRFGDSCANSHATTAPAPSSGPARDSSSKAKQLCVFNLTTGCRFGDKCDKEHREIQSEEEMGQVYEWMKKHNPDLAEQLMHSAQQMMQPEDPQPKSKPAQVQSSSAPKQEKQPPKAAPTAAAGDKPHQKEQAQKKVLKVLKNPNIQQKPKK